MTLLTFTVTGRPHIDIHEDYMTLMRSDHARFWEYRGQGHIGDDEAPTFKAVFVTDTGEYIMVK